MVRWQETEHSIAVNITNSNMAFSYQQDHPTKICISLYFFLFTLPSDSHFLWNYIPTTPQRSYSYTQPLGSTALTLPSKFKKCSINVKGNTNFSWVVFLVAKRHVSVHSSTMLCTSSAYFFTLTLTCLTLILFFSILCSH